MRNKDPEMKLCTTIEISYKGKVLFETQLDSIINESDLRVEIDLKSLPVCSRCEDKPVYHKHLKDGLCKRCLDRKARDDDAAVQQMFDIGYW